LLKGRRWFDLWPVEAKADIESALEEARCGRTTNFEAFCPTAKGRAKWWDTTVSPVIDGLGRVIRMLARSLDITAQRLAAEGLEAALIHAEAASRAKSDFLANMSHEIRTPLNGIVGGAAILARDRRGRDEVLDMIRSSSAELERVLGDILDFARIQSDEITVVAEPFGLSEVLRDAASLLQRRFAAKGLALAVCIDAAAERRVIGDRAHIKQILSNLLSNALKFTEAGCVELSVGPAGANAWRIAVCDTGIGFDIADRARIFSGFEQGDGSSTRRFGGSGLGLAISGELVRAMGGRFDAESCLGQGSTFTLTLPLPDAPAEPDLPDAQPGDEAEIERLPKVLVVDDHPANRRIVELVLSQVGAPTVPAENGAEAVVAFEREPFDLILMDIQMPVMDGLAATRAIRAIEAERRLARTPILMLSANVLPEHVAASRSAGADDHLAKPLQIDRFFAAIQSLSDRAANAHSAGP
jgi:signal transduction histidine kinase/ActR/RegA family two-component response regulator